jgi:hypothetical protein
MTSLNWKQAAKPLHIEQHRHSLSITKSYGEKGILFSISNLTSDLPLNRTVLVEVLFGS